MENQASGKVGGSEVSNGCILVDMNHDWPWIERQRYGRFDSIAAAVKEARRLGLNHETFIYRGRRLQSWQAYEQMEAQGQGAK